MLDRLMLDDARIDGIVSAMREVAGQPDPIGEVVGGRTLASGIRLTQVRVPLGVIGMIYEARPNVTADAICLAMRTGNAVVLRGGSAARESCKAIVEACRAGICRRRPAPGRGVSARVRGPRADASSSCMPMASLT